MWTNVKEKITTGFGIVLLLIPILSVVGVIPAGTQGDVTENVNSIQGAIISLVEAIAALVLIFKAKDG